MKKEIEYRIYLGLKDKNSKKYEVSFDEFKALISTFFAKEKIGFSLIKCQGGYLFENETFETEDTVCINLVGSQGLNLARVANSLSMLMNQECLLITKEEIEREYR